MEISAINLQGPVVADDCEFKEIEHKTDSVAQKVFAELPRIVEHKLPRIVSSELPRIVEHKLPRIVSSELPRIVGSALPRVVRHTPPGC